MDTFTTVSDLKKLEPRGERYEVRDTEQPKLRVRVNPSGILSFVLVKKVDGRTERMTLGRFPEVTLDVARTRSLVMLGEVAAGKNPADARRKAKGETTLRELWDAYLAHAKRRKRSWKNEEYQFKKHLAEWKGRRLDQLRKSDVARLHRRIEREHGGYAANRVVGLLSSMWGFAQKQLELDRPSPCHGVSRAKESPRSRYLSEDELRRFYVALAAYPVEDSRDALSLLLWTAQRKATVLAMEWGEVDLTGRRLVISGKRMKSGRDHEVPLAAPAVAILERRKDEAEKGDRYVFPSVRGAAHMVDVRVPLEAICTAAGIEGRFTPHDLRRTWATYARELGRDPAPILDHRPQGVTEAHYAQATMKVQRLTVDAVVAHLLTIATTDPEAKTAKVVKFPVAGVRGE